MNQQHQIGAQSVWEAQSLGLGNREWEQGGWELTALLSETGPLPQRAPTSSPLGKGEHISRQEAPTMECLWSM